MKYLKILFWDFPYKIYCLKNDNTTIKFDQTIVLTPN